jgi:excisionase family DNA binding protein
MTSEWMTTKELADYSRLGVSTIKRLIKLPRHRLPSHFVAGRRLFRQTEYDNWAMGNVRRAGGGKRATLTTA